MDFNNSASIINSAYANAPDATEEFEGPNEDDAEAGPPLLAFMQLLNDTVRGNPATAAMPIIAPSFTQVSSFATQGNLSSLINFGNMHDYFGNRIQKPPHTGALSTTVADMARCNSTYAWRKWSASMSRWFLRRPAMQSGTGLSDAIIGRYELRTLFESLRLGIIRTFLYELIDDPQVVTRAC